MKKYSLVLSLLCILFALSSCHKNKPDTIKPIDYYKDGDVSKLYYNNTAGVNIVLLGDGFTKADLEKGGNYSSLAKKLIDYLFTVAPFSQNKQNFNAYVVYAQSAQSGSHTGYNPTDTSTKFNTYFDTQIPRLLAVGNYEEVYKYVQYAVPLEKANLIILMVNTQTYGGSGGPMAVLSLHETSKYIMVHEIGHTFGHLGDEYVDTVDSGSYSVSEVPYLPNIDITNDPNKIKWAHFLTIPAYQGVVGGYEGAYFRPTGLYRPEDRSIMTDLGTLNYNAPSREAIARQIDTILNIPFDFNAFIKADAASIQPTFVAVNPNIPLPMHDFVGLKDRIKLMQQRKNTKYYPQHKPVN